MVVKINKIREKSEGWGKESMGAFKVPDSPGWYWWLPLVVIKVTSLVQMQSKFLTKISGRC